MEYRLSTPEGRDLYTLRKKTPKPVFGIITSRLGFSQFSLRGLENVRAKWRLVTMARNITRTFALGIAKKRERGAGYREGGPKRTIFDTKSAAQC